jgi:hypothetical protein
MRLRQPVAVVALIAGLALGGCGDDDAPSTAETNQPEATTTSPAPVDSATPTESPTQAEQVQIVDITIAGGDVQTASDRVAVPLNRTVRLVVTSDVPDELHVHGFDLEAPLEPGVPTTLEFVADEPGVFEVETHESELLLVQLAVQ